MVAKKAEVKVKVDLVTESIPALCAAVDRCFADLVSNIPALRETDNHNEVIKARESFKAALTKKEAEA